MLKAKKKGEKPEVQWIQNELPTSASPMMWKKTQTIANAKTFSFVFNNYHIKKFSDRCISDLVWSFLQKQVWLHTTREDCLYLRLSRKVLLRKNLKSSDNPS